MTTTLLSITGMPIDVRERIRQVKKDLQKRFGRCVPYWEVLQYLIALYEDQKHIPGSKQIFPHVEG